MKESDVTLLRPLWMPFSFVSDDDCKLSVKQWLIDGNYYVNKPENGFTVFTTIPDEFKKCLSLDAFSFAKNSAQTLVELEKSAAYTKLTSWRIIQAYYAAFYSAHALLRFFGRSFSHLEPGHTKFLSERSESEVGQSPILASGNFLMTFTPSDNEVTFEAYKESHKDLWKCFLALTEELSNKSLALRASKERCEILSGHFSEITDLITQMDKHPAGNWLSVVRNEVNYKSLHGVWYPFSKATPAFESLMREAGQWRNLGNEFTNITSKRNDMERFFLTALSVVDLALSISFDYRRLIDASGRRSENFARLIKESLAA